jgi:hydroxymethylglutaryl-CoA reductase (NADPH)
MSDLSIISSQILRTLEHLRATTDETDVRLRMQPQPDRPLPQRLRGNRRASRDSIAALWSRLRAVAPTDAADQSVLADPETLENADAFSANIENMIGTVKVPVGVVGPLRINGLHASGDFFVPLATTEAALIASYARGAAITSRAGGIAAAMLIDGVLRSPGFKFDSLIEAGLFIEWVTRSRTELKAAAEATTCHGKLVSIEPVMDNEIVFLACRYTTGDASGQNMVTIATEALCGYIESYCPIRPKHWFIEVNFSGDKKRTYLGFITGRGRKVTASVVIPRALVERYLHVGVDSIMECARMSSVGALLSGQIGSQGHYANALAAFYIATGQDAACVAESAAGFTRMEPRGEDLFVSVTLPNLLVGSVGGGTGLPSQSANLRLLGLQGTGKAAALAEVAAALCLCGEISIIGAIAAGHFARAHKKLARQRCPRC